MHVDPLSPQSDTAHHGREGDTARKRPPPALRPDPGRDASVDEIVLSEAARTLASGGSVAAEGIGAAGPSPDAIKRRATDGTYAPGPGALVRPRQRGAER